MDEKKVALYIRVSTDKQVKEGESLEAQEDALIKYAREHNYKIINKYIEYGESGQKLNRTALTRLLEDVKKDKINFILLTKLDRWFRSVKDFYKVQEILTEHNVNWKTIWEDHDTTTANGRFQLNVMLSLGELEAQRTAERIRDTFNYKYKVQKTVCSGAKKYGWDIIDKKYVVNEEEAENMRKLFDYFIEQQSISKAVKWYKLNINNISYDTVKKRLKDTSYIGRFINYRGEEVEDFIPAIIEKDIFEKAQKIFLNNLKIYQTKKRTKYNYIFSGLIKCGHCGFKMTGTNNHNINYYRCRSHKRLNRCDFKTFVNENNLEEYVLSNIKNIISKELISIEKEKTKIQTPKTNINKIKAKMNKLSDMYINDIIDLDYYKENYKLLKEQIELEEQKVSIVNVDTSKLEEFINKPFEEVYNKLDDLGKLRFWRAIIKEIIIYSKDNIEVKLLVD